jgi:hypothetical protein
MPAYDDFYRDPSRGSGEGRVWPGPRAPRAAAVRASAVGARPERSVA